MFLLSFLIPDFTLPKSYIIFQLILLTSQPLSIHSVNYYFILIHKYLFVFAHIWIMYISAWFPVRPEEGTGPPGSELTDGFGPLCRI